MKLWVGVSKFLLTFSLVSGVGRKKASYLVRSSYDRRTAIGLVSVLDNISNLQTSITRQNIYLRLASAICFVNHKSFIDQLMGV